jgi:hypothetical protein
MNENQQYGAKKAFSDLDHREDIYHVVDDNNLVAFYPLVRQSSKREREEEKRIAADRTNRLSSRGQEKG